jgi:hypothetical protein
MEPELSNEREKREWLYLCLLAGEDRARAAISKIPDDRSPYPAEIAQVLGVLLPSEEDLPPLPEWLEKGKKEIAKIKQALRENR